MLFPVSLCTYYCQRLVLDTMVTLPLSLSQTSVFPPTHERKLSGHCSVGFSSSERLLICTLIEVQHLISPVTMRGGKANSRCLVFSLSSPSKKGGDCCGGGGGGEGRRPRGHGNSRRPHADSGLVSGLFGCVWTGSRIAAVNHELGMQVGGQCV